MHGFQKIAKHGLAALMLAAMASPASAKRPLTPGDIYGAWAMKPVGAAGFGQTAVLPDAPRSPYAMSYADEVARALGLKNGPVNLFSSGTAKGAHPTLSGGFKHNGLLFKLQW